MKAKTLDGGEIDLKQEYLDSLRSRLRGVVLIPGDPGYDENRSVWNAMIDRKPAAIVRCLGNADVIASINFVREHNLLLCIKGGGHNIAGLATADGAVMLDMSLMRGVFVDQNRKIAHAQAGCLLGDVDRETQLHGLAAVLGFVSATGIAGLTLGGGIGYLTRKYGWTSDNITGIDLVTADAKLIRASSEENNDLFWGLRGGGGNFGVVTGIDYNLYPVGPEIIGGIVAWNASEAQNVYKLFHELTEQAPPELTLAALMRLAPPAPWLPKEIHGKPIIAILACYSGSPEDGIKAVAPIKAFGKPVGDVLIRRPYIQIQSLLDAVNPKGRRGYWKSEYFPRLESAMFDKIIGHAEKIPSPHSVIILFQIGGRLNELREEYSAAGNRNAHFVMNIPGSWDKSEDDNQNIEWVRSAWDDLKSFSSGGNYINFQSEDEGNDRLQAALGPGLRKLREVKAKWDPQNIFRINRNIKPV
jgi:FAD/FMN-containing dehydrogenase